MNEEQRTPNPEEALRQRIKALYHNCMSGACFAMSDAAKESDETEALVQRRIADTYSVVAGWLRNIDA